MSKQILIISFSELHRDPRVKRQINFVKDLGKVTAVGYSDPMIEGVTAIKIDTGKSTIPKKFLSASRLLMRRHTKYYWSKTPIIDALTKIKQNNTKFDLIIANDLDALPLAVEAKNIYGSKLLFDAHEYSPLEFNDDITWRIFYKKHNDALCRNYLRYNDKMITVSHHIAKTYEKNYQVQCEVVTNATHHYPLTPSPVTNDKIDLVHHGIATPSRHLENLITLMDHVDHRFHLHLYLMGNERYITKLKRLASKNQKIKFKQPIPTDKLVNECQAYDIGLIFFPPVNFNYEYCLPNKFFEMIQSRLAIATGPSPEMGPYIDQYRCGITCKTFHPKDLAQDLNALTEDKLHAMKVQAGVAASKLHSGVNKSIMQELVTKLVD